MNTLKFLCSIAILSSILPYYLIAQETYTVRLSQTNSDAFIATSSQIGLPNVGPNVRKMDGEITHNTQLNVQYYNPQGEALRYALNELLQVL